MIAVSYKNKSINFDALDVTNDVPLNEAHELGGAISMADSIVSSNEVDAKS